MRIRLDIIAHTFRNKYLKYNGGISSHSSGSTTLNSTDNWFYEDEKGNLHSRLDLIIDKTINGNLIIKGELTADSIPAITALVLEIETLKLRVAALELKAASSVGEKT